MSAMPIALLLTTAATGAVGVAVLCTVLKLRRQLTRLQAQLAENQSAAAHALLPHARTHADTDRIRAAVAEALAEERERELAEARAFWAAQEARDASDAPSVLGLPDHDPFLPRPSDFAGLEAVAESAADADEFAGESPELAAARRRHPSHPDFVPDRSAAADHERTAATLEELATEQVELSDVRPGPLGIQTSPRPAKEEILAKQDGDRVLLAGGLASAPPDAARHGATDVYLAASHIGLDLTTEGWHRDPPVAVGAAPAPALAHPEYHW